MMDLGTRVNPLRRICMKATKLFVAALLVMLPLAGFAQETKPAESKVTVTPYGFVLLNSYWNTATFAAKDYPGNVAHNQAGGAFLMEARQSRFGVRLGVTDDNWTKAELAGVVEFDFMGGNTTTASTSWNTALMRLRLAAATATWKTGDHSLALLVGQDYGLVNPLFAESITWVANPLFSQAGNYFRRSPQIRATYALKAGDMGFNVAAAILSPADSTVAVGTTNTSGIPWGPDEGAGNASRQPDYEARAAFNAKFGDIGGTVGVSYHYNTRRYTANDPASDQNATVLGVDADLNITKYLQVKGEYYTGTGVDDTYGGLGVGAVATTAPAAPATYGAWELVDSDGYWIQGILKLIPELTITGGFGQAKADQTQLLAAATDPAFITTSRYKNQQIAVGAILNAGKFWRFGVEWMQTQSWFVDNTDQKGQQFALSSMLRF
jgi:hypothetical protein